MIDEKIIDIYRMRDRINALKELCKGKKEYDFTMSGVRISLVWNDADGTELKRNDEGVIELIRKFKDKHDDQWSPYGFGDQIWVSWDNGSSEILIRGKCHYVCIEESK